MGMMGNGLERGRAKSRCRERRDEGGLYKRKQKENEDEQLHFFILYGKKGGEEVDELVNEQNRLKIQSSTQLTLARITRHADINTPITNN